jgi:hypothetical protein
MQLRSKILRFSLAASIPELTQVKVLEAEKKVGMEMEKEVKNACYFFLLVALKLFHSPP